MRLNRSFYKNVGANLFSKSSNAVARIIQIPFLIYYLGVEEFGVWTILFTIPSWLSFSNLGFGTIASNQIAIYSTRNNLNRACQVFSSAVFIVTITAIIFSSLFCLGLFLYDINIFLKIKSTRRDEINYSLLWICFTVFISFYFEIYNGIFRSVDKAHLYVLISGSLPWINLLACFIAFQFSGKLNILSFSIFISNLVFLITTIIMCSKLNPKIKFSGNFVSYNDLRYLLQKGFYFQGFSIGNAFTIQGSLMIIQQILGPVYVTIFSSTRTLINSVKQIQELIGASIWPELTKSMAIYDNYSSQYLHRMSVSISFFLSLINCIILFSLGSWIFEIWLGGNVELPQKLLLLFLLPLPFNAVWFSSSIVHYANNNHEGLSRIYFYCSILYLLFFYLFTINFGMNGAAFVGLFIDLIMLPYVIHKSLLLTSDNLVDFFWGVVNCYKLYFRKIMNIIFTKNI
jgi:O-antigen/teichoic acid export membrane protein